MSTAAAKNRVVRIPRSVFDQFFTVEFTEFVSSGSGDDDEPLIPCVVCRSPKKRDEPCDDCKDRPMRCIWCCVVREEIKGPCPSCKRYGVTHFEERDKSCVYVEDV